MVTIDDEFPVTLKDYCFDTIASRALLLFEQPSLYSSEGLALSCVDTRLFFLIDAGVLILTNKCVVIDKEWAVLAKSTNIIDVSRDQRQQYYTFADSLYTQLVVDLMRENLPQPKSQELKWFVINPLRNVCLECASKLSKLRLQFPQYL